MHRSLLQCVCKAAERFRGYLPGTLAGRFLLVMFTLVLTSQLVVTYLWQNQMKNDREEALAKVSTSVATRVSATIMYFVTLSENYRQIVINKMKYMGGVRYYVTLNEERIKLAPFQMTAPHNTVLGVFQKVLDSTENMPRSVYVGFSRPGSLKVMNNNTFLKDLPGKWGKEILMVEPLELPVLVIQVGLDNGQWLYLATLMPDSSILSEEDPSFAVTTSWFVWMLILLVLSTLAIHIMARPFEALSRAAKEFGCDLEPVSISERGCLEYERTARAFNQMQTNIRHYINDRKQLFSGISHDLKTPITRLRLRAELLDEEQERQPFIDDLKHLEIMVKSALQTVSDTDIHENPEVIDLGRLLNEMTLAAQSVGQRAWLHNKGRYEITGKPLALKRCLQNLLDNAIYYGAPANIYILKKARKIEVLIRDSGPGIPEGMEEKVFKPYLRLKYGCDCNPDGNGLGLVTARHLARIHGGSLRLRNHPEGGLEVTLELPVDRKSCE